MGVAEFSAATMGTRHLTPSSDEVSASNNFGAISLVRKETDTERLAMPLRVTIELIPRGDEQRRKTMGTLDIENTGDHPRHPTLANYRYRMTGPINGGEVGKWHEGTLRDVDRDKGYWAHVKAVLAALDCDSKPMAAD